MIPASDAFLKAQILPSVQRRLDGIIVVRGPGSH